MRVQNNLVSGVENALPKTSCDRRLPVMREEIAQHHRTLLYRCTNARRPTAPTPILFIHKGSLRRREEGGSRKVTNDGENMKSGNKNYLKYLSNHKTLGIHVSAEELERYHSLTAEQKRLLRIIVKTLIYNPDLLSESSYLYKLLTSKAVSPYVCPLCLMPFSSYFSLKQHIRYTEHTTTCPVCKKEFQKTDALLDHVCKKHNICVS
jgi:hypothetical protein